MRYFNKITLQTPESVKLEFVLAGIGNRAFALLIDYTILGLVFAGAVLSWSFFSYQLIQYLDKLNINYSGLQNWLIAIPLLILFMLFVGYFVIFETFWQGQTPGKRFVKIRVIQENGRPVGLAQSTLRAMLRPLDDAMWLGTFFILLGKREKRLGDWVAATVVVQEEQTITSENFILSANAQGAAEQLLQVIDFSLMLPDDFAVIREYLQRRAVMNPQARVHTAERLAKQMKALLQAEMLSLDALNPDLFLEASYLAYQKQIID
jgi:uncharacterized RDD family membrane protein YckC